VATFVPLVIMAFWIGLYPKPFFQILQQPVEKTISMVRGPDYLKAGTVNASAKPAEAQPQIPAILDDRGGISPRGPKPVKAPVTAPKTKGKN